MNQGGGAAAATPTIYAINGMTAGNRYEQASSDDGDILGFAYSILWSYESLATGATKTLVDHDSFSGYGGYFRLDATHNLKFGVANAALGLVNSPARTWAAGDLNKWCVATGVYDPTAALVRLYVQGVQVGSGTAIASHGPAVNRKCAFGARAANDQPAIDCAIAGVSTWVGGFPSNAQVLAHYTACVAANDMSFSLGTLTAKHTYSVKSSQVGGLVPATIADAAGAKDLTKVGAPTIKAVLNPVYI